MSNVTASSGTELDDDTLLSWRRSKQDVPLYPILDNDLNYCDWIIKTKRQFIGDECEQMIDSSVHYSLTTKGGSDKILWDAQINHLASLLNCVLKTNEEMRLVRTYPNNPCKIWSLHETHSLLSTISSNICTMLNQSLAKMKITEFDHPLQGLDKFDSNLQKFNKVSRNKKMLDDIAIAWDQLLTVIRSY